MKTRLTFGLLIVALLSLYCSKERPAYICTDRDGDGYGNGLACDGPDCNDADESCNAGECCQACLDQDGDGYGEGDDCDGADCNDSDENCHEGDCCTDCIDFDGDGYGTGGDCTGPDCNDSDFQCHEGDCCDNCNDQDGDGYGEGPDCLGADCDDTDNACFVGACCADCDDPDGDGYGAGADCLGPDCDETDDTCHQGDCCTPCPDNETRCNGICVDTRTDEAHCGSCTVACDATEVCRASACSCPDDDSDGWDVCDPAATHDGDGFAADCDDDPATGSSVNPGQVEICGDAVDEDCSGDIDDLDADSDGYVAVADPSGNDCSGDDCDDGDFDVNPGATEACNNVDDNCDGSTDENSDEICYTGAAGTEGEGVCVAGLSYCLAGTPGPCLGQVVPGPEACNGLDDDCDGRTDEDTVTLTCGVGECAASTSSCVNGTPQQCVPGTPAGAENCGDGLDDDCNGLIDDGCGCVHVAPFGDDNTGDGTEGLPLQTIGAGIALASMQGQPPSVCVGAQANCNWTFYDEDVIMVDGISVQGGYDTNNSPWTQSPLHANAPTCVTEIRGQTGRGLVFDVTVTNPTVLDNFALSLDNSVSIAAPTAAITVQGSTGAVIQNCSVFGAPNGNFTYGIHVTEDATGVSAVAATPLIVSSTVEGGAGATSAAVYSFRSRPIIQTSCSPANITAGNRCLYGCTNGIHIRGNRFTGGGVQYPDFSYGILLEESPGALIDQSVVCSSGNTEATGIKIIGDATGTAITRSDVTVWRADIDNGVAVENCAGASPWIADNARLGSEGNPAGTARVAAVRAAGNCHPLIEGNLLIIGGIEGATNETRGVVCQGDPISGIASQCSIINNQEIRGSNNNFPTDSMGILCADGGCNHIRGNRLIQGYQGINVVGIKLVGPTHAMIDSNRIVGGCGTSFAAAILAQNGSARIQNNGIYGGTCTGGSASGDHFFGVFALLDRGPNELDVHSNWIHGGGTHGANCDSRGVSFDLLFGVTPPIPARGILRNNIIESGDCPTSWAIEERDLGADPRIVENNDLLWPNSSSALYLDESANGLDIAGVNAMGDIQASSGNIDLDPMLTYPGGGFVKLDPLSPCRNAGTSAGAPAWDFEGDTRPQEQIPDIGPDEVVP